MSTRYFAMAELELTFMGHISGSTALRVVPVLFPPVSMGCWDEVNFKPYKRCHKLHVMANSSLSFLRLRSSVSLVASRFFVLCAVNELQAKLFSDVTWRMAWVTPNKWGGRSAPIYLSWGVKFDMFYLFPFMLKYREKAIRMKYGNIESINGLFYFADDFHFLSLSK